MGRAVSRMTRAEFILLTVGAELHRAGTYLHHQQVLRDFEAALPELEGDGQIDQVVLRWWRPDGTFAGGTAMKLTPPGAFAGPGFEGGDYVADGKLPDEPGYALQVAVHRYDERAVAMSLQAGENADPWHRPNRDSLDAAAGVVTLPGRYLPWPTTVIRMVADEHDRAELLKARAIEDDHGRDEVVAAIDARLLALPSAPPAPRRVGRLGTMGLLPLLLASACAWADPRVPERQRGPNLAPPPDGACRGCRGKDTEPSLVSPSLLDTCSRCAGTGREPTR